MGIEEEDWYDTWLSDAESAESRGMIGTARAIIDYALKVFPDQKSLWQRAAELEKVHENKGVWMLFSVGQLFIVLKGRCCG
jgi:pre-mRNA-processing factor 6